MRVLGIDPGYERLGIAVVEKQDGKDVLLFSECFQTSKNLAFHERILLIGNRVGEIIREYSPDTLSIETLFFNSNQKTAMNVAESRGVVLYEVMKQGLSVYEYTPLQIKIAITGHGRSDKTQVTEMVKRLIKTEKKEMKDDEYDAIGIALTCFASYKQQGIHK